MLLLLKSLLHQLLLHNPMSKQCQQIYLRTLGKILCDNDVQSKIIEISENIIVFFEACVFLLRQIILLPECNYDTSIWQKYFVKNT